MRNKLLFIPAFVSVLFSLEAQEPQFTQFYATPMFLNPAFTGLTDEHRFSAGYRMQWPGIRKTFTTYMAGYDYNLSDLNSGVGIFAMQDRAGTANLVTTVSGLNYAYSIKVDRNSEIRAALSGAFAQKKLDYSSLVFNDQLISGQPVTVDMKADRISYLDMGAGAVYHAVNYWAGLSARHINRPNVSMTGAVMPLPVYLSLHGGYRHVLEESGAARNLEEYVSAAFNLRRQGKNDQLDIGAYYFKNIINVGLWYRGLPFKRYGPGYSNNESVAVLLGLEMPEKLFRIGYSFDITVSQLGLGNTQGAHEIALVYEMAKKSKRTRRTISTPKF